MTFSRLALFSLASLLVLPKAAPQTSATPAAASAPTAVPSLVPYSGLAAIYDGKTLAGETGITFLIYKEEAGGEPLWAETQTVLVDSTGHYKVQLGATSPNGLPAALFTTGEARWLEVQVAGQSAQPRVLLASVPYALKAADATTLGGLPASAYALAGQKSAPGTAIPGASPEASSTVTTPGGTAGFVPEFSGASTIVDSPIFTSGKNVGIGTSSPIAALQVNGATIIDGGMTVNGTTIYNGPLDMPAAGTATPTTPVNSQFFKMYTSAFNSSTEQATSPRFELQAQVVGNNTSHPTAALNLLASTSSVPPGNTGFSINTSGIVTFATGQTFPGAGAITGVTAGTGLTGGGTSGNVTLNLNTGQVPLLAANNYFSGNQTVNGAVSANSFSGSGAGLSGVVAANSAELGGLSAAYYAELAANNIFTAPQSFTKIGIGTPAATSPLATSLLDVQATATSGLGPVITLTNTAGGLGAKSALDFNTLLPSSSGTYNPMARITAQDADQYSDNLLFQSNIPGARNNGLQTNMVITSAGLVGIGTTTPTSELQVNGGVSATYFAGSGAGLTSVTASNASELGGLAPSAFAQLAASNSFSKPITFAAGQTFPGTGPGTITGITAGAYLTGGGTAGSVTLNLDTTSVPTLAGTNTFNGAYNTFNGELIAETSGDYALFAESDGGYAVYGESYGSDLPTMYAINYESDNYGSTVLETYGGNFGGECTINVSGELYCNGGVGDVVKAGDGGRQVQTYSVQSAENWLEDAGGGQLINGVAHVDLEPLFGQTVNTGVEYHVFLTPDGDCKGLYVSAKSNGGFDVHELGGGKSNIAFEYRIMAKRTGYEKVRLVDVTDRLKQEAEQREKMRPARTGARSSQMHTPSTLTQPATRTAPDKMAELR